tara:strand:+ start:228 stop:1328 length:1101 start_codon:yes stop_codon:yes gene_type:complete
VNLSVFGVGKLGLCFSLTLSKSGYRVCGLDVNEDYVASLNNKSFKSSEAGVTEALLESFNFRATTDLDYALNFADTLFVIVATPSLPNGRYDHSQVDALVDSLVERGAVEHTKNFVVCCTVMPGYCDKIKKKLNPLNYVVSYNPEFIAQGTILRDQAEPDMVLIGEGNERAGNILENIYNRHTSNKPRICRMSPLEAEITKLSLNCFLTTKIAYANMIGDIVTAVGGDPKTVLNAIGQDSRIGNKYLGYGYGYGGPCFPRDNRALALFAKDNDVEALISLASDQSNADHLVFQIKNFLLTHDLEEEVEFDFVTYKKESTLLTESQQLAFAVGIARGGCKVKIKERKEVIEELKKRYDDLFTYEERK